MPDGHIAPGQAINNIAPDGELKKNDSLFGCFIVKQCAASKDEK